jgi:hypothetical protein
MNSLRGAHVGETASIIGLGPSIRSLRARDVAPGPVITINHAILYVRKLHLPNPIYVMQKDGCIDHLFAVPPPTCICPSPRMVEPIPPEIVLLSAVESSHCFTDYDRRHVFDVEADFGLPWTAMSTPVAARIAHLMGCTALNMIAHDAYTRGLYGRAPGGGMATGSARGYRRASVQARDYAKSIGMAIVFR